MEPQKRVERSEGGSKEGWMDGWMNERKEEERKKEKRKWMEEVMGMMKMMAKGDNQVQKSLKTRGGDGRAREGKVKEGHKK